MMEDLEEKPPEFTYGDGSGFINVYLPRMDGTLADMRNVSPPSPVFTLENIYKFSDQVMHDRQLFLNRKAYLTRYLPRRDNSSNEIQKKEKTKSAPVLISDREERESELPAINVVKLSLDASRGPVHSPRDRRFNERLSAYVTRKKKIQSTDDDQHKENTKDSDTSENVTSDTKKLNERANKLLGKPPLNTDAVLRKPRMRKGLMFFNRNSTNLDKNFFSRSATYLDKTLLPRLNSPVKVQSQPTTLTLNTERTMWFPDSIISGAHLKFSAGGRLPTRPSSKPNKIWRQSTDNMSTTSSARGTKTIEKIMSTNYGFYETIQTATSKNSCLNCNM